MDLLSLAIINIVLYLRKLRLRNKITLYILPRIESDLSDSNLKSILSFCLLEALGYKTFEIFVRFSVLPVNLFLL